MPGPLRLVPIDELTQPGRLQEVGRIRLGKQIPVANKPGKTRPVALDHFRFTSPDLITLTQVAEAFGGEVRPWVNERGNPRNQYEVEVTQAEIPVWVTPGGLSTIYEHNTGAGRVRACTGKEPDAPGGMECCTVLVKLDDEDYEHQQMPCQCRVQNRLICKPRTRLMVVLPDIRFAGGWLLQSNSWEVARHLQGKEEYLAGVQAITGTVAGKIRIIDREAEHGRKQYKVVDLVIESTPRQIAEGNALGLGTGVKGELVAKVEDVPPALDTGSAIELGGDATSYTGDEDLFGDDDEIIEAEIVDEGHSHEPEGLIPVMATQLMEVADRDKVGISRLLGAVAKKAGAESWVAMTEDQAETVVESVSKLHAGALTVVRITDEGELKVKRA